MKYEFNLQIEGLGESQLFVIPIGKTLIGRQKGNDLQLEDPQISRQHAQIICTNTDCQIMDLGSSNGTYVNNTKLSPNILVHLSQDDEIKIGSFTLYMSSHPLNEQKTRTEVEPSKVDAAEKFKTEEGLEEEICEFEKVSAAGYPPEPPTPPDFLYPIHPAKYIPPPGLGIRSTRLINYLPEIYHTDFMVRYLGLLESIQTPIEWNIDNFDLYLDPGTCDSDFLQWLAKWFEITFNDSWNEEQRRTLVKEAHLIYSRRGTRWALSRILEIYIDDKPEINDSDEHVEPYTFLIRIPKTEKTLDLELIEEIIDVHKPAHTSYTLKIGSN
jgi:phage tail-like protein